MPLKAVSKESEGPHVQSFRKAKRIRRKRNLVGFLVFLLIIFFILFFDYYWNIITRTWK